MENTSRKNIAIKRRTFEIVQVGKDHDTPSIAFDFFIAAMIFINLFITVFKTFDTSLPYFNLLKKIEFFTMIIFGIEYMLRLWTAEYLYPKKRRGAARWAFMRSFYGLIDLLTFLPFFLPYFLPVFFPPGIAAFRMLRVIRIFHMFKINAYYDAFNVITDVLMDKKDQIFSSVCLVLILIVASSLCMYSLEHEAQPEVFRNAFSGIWWCVITILTIGYGDVYPVTVMGQMMGIFISLLGVGMVAIPTGIISAGFVEHYTKVKTLGEYTEEADIRFITLRIEKGKAWENIKVSELDLPHGLILAAVCRGQETIVPRGDTVLKAGDKLVVGAEGYKDEIGIKLRELVLRDRHPWVGNQIKDLDISRQTLIVMVRRGEQMIIPNGSLVMQAGDMVVLYSKKNIRDSVEINL